MRILHVTPHLPPDQAANALLPWQLGEWAHSRGDEVEYLAHPPRAGRPGPVAGPVTWLPRNAASGLLRLSRVGSLLNARRIWRAARPAIARADVVHLHSNGLLAECCALLAARAGKPTVLTLYGTEIWHYAPRRGVDLFTRAYGAARVVTFYSERLLLRARELGLARSGTRVIYPSVAPSFTFHDDAAQQAARDALGVSARHLLVNVKRLHPLAGQRYLVEALGEVVREFPDTRLVICGTGDQLEPLRAAARAAGVERHVQFAGLVDNATVARYCAAADLFVLPSLLEALPTVAVEALAAGTPVLSSDNPGGLELAELFGADVGIVAKSQAQPLAEAILTRLRARRRTHPSTQALVEKRFRADAVAAAYWRAYADAMHGSPS